MRTLIESEEKVQAAGQYRMPVRRPVWLRRVCGRRREQKRREPKSGLSGS